MPDEPSVGGLVATAVRPVHGLQRTVEVDVDTRLIAPAAVHGPHRVRITLPPSYGGEPGISYPVLYLLHGGAGGSSAQWTTGGGEVERVTAGRDVIVVMPDGGKVGWYVDWFDTSRGVQSWEQFHFEELIPWIDRNLSTVADRRARAIAGVSMGGFGALRYAQRRPEVFSYAASLSGALSLRHRLVQATIWEQTLVNRLGAQGPFGRPGRGGSWVDHDPIEHLDALRGTRVALYAGTGRSVRDPIERTVAATTRHFHEALTGAGVEHSYSELQRQPGHRWQIEHDYAHWNAALEAVLADMTAHLSPPRPTNPV